MFSLSFTDFLFKETLPVIKRPESAFLSMYLAISTTDLSAICNIKASVSVELNGDKREASIND